MSLKKLQFVNKRIIILVKEIIGESKLYIILNSVYEFVYKENSYKVILTRIERAGANSFKLAAYISFEKYNR